ncbi:gliding motility-associated C-terminal domain-containing protein, partial [Pedobacter nyackensis]
NGTVTIAAGTSAGSYTLSYRICENLNPGNCDMATATIVVSMAPIDAIDDNYTATPVNGASGGVTASVLGNDLLNGGILSPSAVTLTAVSVPSGLSLNADGTVTIAAGTAAGSYTLSYRICENLNPGNCDMATATIVVSMAPIDAIDNDYTATPVNGASGGVTASVLGNDLLNGVILSPSAVTLTAVSVPSGLSLNANGTVSIAAGTAAGSYTLSYRICENLNSGNCDIAEATVFVIVPSIALVKTAAVSSDGMRIAYSFVVTNTGNVTLSNVVLNDPRLGVAGRSVSAILAPGASSTVTINYTISQADRDAKGVTNTATVNAASPDGISVSDVSGTAQNNSTPTFTEISSTPAIALVKTAAVSPDGNSVSYNFVITNTGNITLNGISLTDTKLGISSRTIAGTLAPGQSTSITVIYTTTAADKTANLVTNTAKVDAVAIGGGAVSDVSGTAQNNDNPTVVVLFDGEVLDIPSLFTPNGDGRNDRFEIRGLDQYLENELIIVNRWGNEVYKQSNYKNDWLGEGLNEGTYYYVLRVKKNTTSGWRTYKGYITLLRTSN